MDTPTDGAPVALTAHLPAPAGERYAPGAVADWPGRIVRLNGQPGATAAVIEAAAVTDGGEAVEVTLLPIP